MAFRSLSVAGLVLDPVAFRLKLLGDSPELVEHFYLLSAERRIQHPLVQRLVQAQHDATPARK